ncbi:hypothetical protein EDD99_3556 [Streptomyces sp. 846.5]|nr:hypothetical protein EDD99_3556 [Streptomyces sp. 846.5]
MFHIDASIMCSDKCFGQVREIPGLLSIRQLRYQS